MERVINVRVEGVRARLTGRVGRLLRERELFLRGDGKLRFIRLTRSRQIALSAACLGLAVWLVGATAGLAFLGLSFVAAQQETRQHRLAYQEVLVEAGAYQTEVARMAADFEANQDRLLSRLAAAGATDGSHADVHAPLTDTEIGKARAVLARQPLRARLDQAGGAPDRDDGAVIAAAEHTLQGALRRLETEVAGASADNAGLAQQVAALEGALATARSENETLATEKAAFHAELRSLYQEIAAAPQREAALSDRISDLEVELAAANARAGDLRDQRNYFEVRAEKLEDRLDEVSEIQGAIVQRLTERTLTGIDMIEHVVAMTGLNVNELIKDMSVASLGLAQGGPFVPGDFVIEADPHLEFQTTAALLDQQMDRWEALQQVVRTIPLSSPLDHYRVSSGFGDRKDPVNGRSAMHYGIDLKAPNRTPVLAPAPGTVVFAGWRGHYGRVVEIDHGHGIRSRYAHLRKILVKPGQPVAHRDKIGLLGSSGRSTGPHLHYEIEVYGKPYDPSRFLMAGRNAFKG